MLIRLHVASDGSIASSAVRTSTAPDPSLDEKVVAAMATWKFPTTSAGEIDVDYPIVLAHNPDEEARLESDLQTKVASLSPTESPEYASAPLPEASPIAASSPEGAGAASPGAAASPAMASVPPPEAAPAPEPSVGAEVAKRPHHKHLKVASAPPPSVFDQVQERLKANPKLRRVKAYTTGGSVTLFGKVFGEGEKSQAEETVRNIPGVTGVIDNIATDEGEWADQQNRIQQQLANSGLDKVTVKVIGHDAFLNGEVKTDLEKTRAVTVAEAAAPVTVRENLIRVTPGNMFGF
jgi:osmotically-inducible protein OsmY